MRGPAHRGSTGTPIDPALALAELGIPIEERELDGLLGYWDHERRVVVLAGGLSETERRCTLAHELMHAERGDVGCADLLEQRAVERAVEEVTARCLVPLHDLVDALRRHTNLPAAASWLGIDTDTLYARLDTLTKAEREYVGLAGRMAIGGGF